MREVSQEKGKKYQRAVKHWLSRNSLLGLSPELFGDAYDITNKATEIGGQYFDFSLKLSSNNDVKSILYAECKYRSETNGNINAEFKEFLRKIYLVISKNKDEAKHAEFFFISNIPPDDWRALINKKSKYILLELSMVNANEEIVHQMSGSFHIMVLSERLIEV